MQYDYIIVGAGLTGAVIARELTDLNFKCLVVDRRKHVGGNCYTKDIDGINVHMYGPHIFHTSDIGVWYYLNKHTTVNNFTLRPKLKHKEKMYSLPINLTTMNQLWGVTTPKEAKEWLNAVREDIVHTNAEEWCLANVGREIYEIFFRPYSIKQWGKEPKEIPSSVMERQIVRTNYNDNYFDDIYQGIPDYTLLFDNLLKGIMVQLNTEYKGNENVIYSGAIDEYYDYKYGALEYRSLRFEHERIEIKDYQGVAMVNYPELKYPFTRIVEHKHFEFGTQNHTVITMEESVKWKKGMEAYYPVNDKKNVKLYNKYDSIDDTVFVGRLGKYEYMNMDVAIRKALDFTNSICHYK